MTTDVSKFSVYAISTSLNSATVSKFGVYVIATTKVSRDYSFQYNIEAPRADGTWSSEWNIEQGAASGTWSSEWNIEQGAASGTWSSEWNIEQGAASGSWSFEWDMFAPFETTREFQWSIDLYTTREFKWHLLGEESDLLGYRNISPGRRDTAFRSFPTGRTATTLNEITEFGSTPASPPEHTILDSVEQANYFHFYADYYERIWVDPSDYRLSNPKIGFQYPFYVWNAYNRPNQMTTYTPTDVGGTTFVEESDLPITFGAIEFRTMHFTINEDAPSQIEGDMFFDFTMGGDGFHLFALVLGVLKTLPNEPFNEIWSWFSVIETSRNGTEQRQALRDEPRTQAGYTVMLLDEEDRRIAYQQLFSFATRSVLVPFFQYSTTLDADVENGDTRLYFDLSQSDIRAEEYLVLFQPDTYQYQLLQVSTLNSDGVNLMTPIMFDADMTRWEVVPARNMRLPNKSSLGMEALTGTLSFKGESTTWRELLRPSSAVTLPEYDGLPVIPYEPIAVQDVDETFDSDVEVIDNDSAPPTLRSTYTNPFIEQTKQFLIDRTTEMDWWRTFFDYTKGMLRPFLAPTWREDLPLAEEPGLGDTEILTTNTDYADYFAYNTYKYVQIQSDAGTIYRKVTAVEYDPAGLKITLDDTIGLTAGSNLNMVVSFLNLTRLNSDEVKLEHYVNHTIIEIETRTVNQ